MADTVRYLMEGMLEELDAYENLGWFSKEEIRKIVKERTNHEYNLKRRAALKTDFLRYIEYEEKLEKLRQIRRRKFQGKDPTEISKGKNNKHEGYILRRIHFIYERAFRKFWGDLRLWMAYFDFCKTTKANKLMSKALTRCLQLHPNEPGIWSYAASWEFESNHNVEAARSLMLRGLRTCKNSIDLWLEYFKMELLYALKLRKRREVLGLEENEESEQKNAMQSVMDGAVACIVYKNASAANVMESTDHLRFLDFAKTTGNFPVVVEFLEERIWSQFETSIAVWEYRATSAEVSAASLEGGNQDSLIHGMIEVYEEAILAMPTPAMFLSYAKSLQRKLNSVNRLLNSLGQEHEEIANTREGTQYVALLDNLFERAEAVLNHCPESCTLLQMMVGHSMRNGNHHAALGLAERCCHMHPRSEEAWISCLLARHRALCIREPDAEEWKSALLDLLTSAAKALPTRDSAQFWSCGLRLWSGSQLPADTFVDLLDKKLQDSEGGSTLCHVTSSCVRWVWLSAGIEQGRRLSDRWTCLPGAGAPLFLTSLHLEWSLGAARSCERLGRLLSRAEDLHGHDNPDIWLFHIRLDGVRGAGPSRAHWQAKQELGHLSTLESALQQGVYTDS